MANRPAIAEELKSLMLQFSISVLVELPSDLVSYAAEYFSKQVKCQREQHPEIENLSDSSIQSDEDLYTSILKTSLSKDPLLVSEDDTKTFLKTKEQLDEIRACIQRCYIFRCLSNSQLRSLIDVIKPIYYQPGDIVFRQRDVADIFYVVGTGKYEAFVTKLVGTRHFVQLYDTQCLGELMDDRSRPFSVRAITSGRLWMISKKAFRQFAAYSIREKRKRYMPLFKIANELESLEARALNTVCDAVTPLKFGAGQMIIDQGSFGDGGLYFMERGEVAVLSLKDGAEPKLVNTVNVTGNFFGVAKGESSRFAYKAVTNTSLAYLDYDCVHDVLKSCREKILWHLS